MGMSTVGVSEACSSGELAKPLSKSDYWSVDIEHIFTDYMIDRRGILAIICAGEGANREG